ncbi:MAG: Na/Pi symporter [Acidobacteriota bacterium]|nr:Na/Pi symporter [Acidobacteriota bacterium]
MTSDSPVKKAIAGRGGSTVLRAVLLALLLYGFFLGLDLMGLAFKLFGKGFAETLIESTANPFVGLFIGILATTLVQSSSTTTSMTVALVAAGGLTIEGAIPIIMGANIGTSVTNTLVSLAHVNRREEFRRAFAGATVHDFFNWLAVLVFLPLEMTTHYLARTSTYLASALEGVGGTKLFNPLKAIVRPLAKWVQDVLSDSGALVLAAGVLLLILCLKFLVDLLKVVMTGRAEGVLHRTLFRSAPAAIVAGVLMTVMVQSSSITTSVMVPLVGAGVVTLRQVFPYTIGANIGTTVTAMLAALSTGSTASVTVAFAHLLFNLSASAVIYLPPPVRAIPLALAEAVGRIGAENRLLAAVYILGLFFALPILLLVVTGTL